MAQVSANQNQSESSKEPLGKIAPTTILETVSSEPVPETEEAIIEKKIIEATRLLLREFGIRKSRAGIRDAVGTEHKRLGQKEAVSALSNLGFKASFGSIKIKKLTDDFFL